MYVALCQSHIKNINLGLGGASDLENMPASLKS